MSSQTGAVRLNRKGFSRRDIRERLSASACFTPFAILFLVFTVLPVVLAIYFSFTTYSVVQPPIWKGIDNYRYLITEDNVFLIALSNTFSFALFSGVIGYIMSFIMAWVIDNMPFRMFFALAFYAPSITSGIAMSVVWLWFFSPDSMGLINNVLIQMGWISSPILWTQTPSLILPMVCIVSVWMGMGNGFLSFLAGFQNLSKEISEAGAIDGVHNKFEELIYIILPQMKPMLLYGAVTSIVGAFSTYEIPLTLAGSPGPENASLTLVGHLNDYAFTRLDLGYGSAVAVILFLITFILSRVMFRVLQEKD